MTMYKELEKEKTVTISIMFELSVEHDIISNLVVMFMGVPYNYFG
jgi:hypothetical protein